MKWSSTKELLIPFENPKQVFRSRRKLFDTPSLVESNSPASDQLSKIEEQIKEEEVTETLTETMEQYMSKTCGDYGSGVTRPLISQDTHFEMNGAAGPGFYQRNNGNSSYPPRRVTMEESLSKFMIDSAKRHEENSTIIKEIRDSTDAAIRNQGASIKTLGLQIRQISKVLQERGFGCLPSSAETNLKDQVKSISTATTDFSDIRRFGN
nr:hypothetical protein [Tanacetum cinerariifolium]